MRKLKSSHGFDLLECSKTTLVVRTKKGSIVGIFRNVESANKCLSELSVLSSGELRLLGLL